MRTIGIAQGTGDHYPFIDPSDDIKDVVADISLGISTEINSVAIQRLDITANNVDICLVNEDNSILFDSTRGLYSRKTDSLWGGAYRIIYWEGNDIQLKLVLYANARYAELYPENATLDLRTIFVKPKYITSFTVIDKNGVSHKYAEKQLVFKTGYNMNLAMESTNSGVRRQNTLTLNAGAGYGLGRVPYTEVEEDDRVLRTLNSVSTEEGKMNIVVEDGYGFDLAPEGSKLYLYNTDTPCCTCDEIEDLRRYIDEVAALYWGISDTMDEVQEKHASNVARWQNSPAASKITRDPFIVQATGDGCKNIVVRADFTNLNSVPISQTITLELSYLTINRKTITCPSAKTSTVYYEEDGVTKSKEVTTWTMVTTVDNTVSAYNPSDGMYRSLTLTTSHLEPGKTMSVQLSGTYVGARYNNVPTFYVRGIADGVSNITKTVDCSCNYTVDDVSSLSNSNTVTALYNKIWEIRSDM